MRDFWFTIQRIEFAKTEFFVVAITQIHVLGEGMECHRAGFAVCAIPNLIERVWRLLMRHQLLVGGLHGIIEQCQAEPG